MSSPELRFKCPKCRHTGCEIGEIRAAGGFWSKMLDVQNRKLSTVTCGQCRYTEFYAADSSSLGHIFDLFTG